MSLSKAAVLAAFSFAGAEAPDLTPEQIAFLGVQDNAIVDVSEDVAPRIAALGVTGAECDAANGSPDPITPEMVGTDKELQIRLARARQQLPCHIHADYWYSGEVIEPLSPSVKAMYDRIVEVTKLSNQADLMVGRANIHFSFEHQGQPIKYGYEGGDGSFLYFSIGSKSYELFMNFFPANCHLFYYNSEERAEGESFDLFQNEIKMQEINQALDIIIVEMKKLIAQKPVYRRLKESPDVVSNHGANIRGSNKRIRDKAPRGTYFQVVDGLSFDDYVFVYFVDEYNEVESGWVHQGLLGEPQDSYNKNLDPKIELKFIARMRVTDDAASSGGLNLRTHDDAIIGKIPVGTVVNVIQKSATSNQWVEVCYIDPTTGQEMTGWACISYKDDKYLEQVE